MARPGGARQAVPGAPLAGVLLDLAREARKTTFGQGADTQQLQAEIDTLTLQVRALTEAINKLQTDFAGYVTPTFGPCT